MSCVSLEGPVELVDGELVLRIPLSAGGKELVETAGRTGVVDGEHLVIVLEPWLVKSLRVEDGSLVVVDNEQGRLRITRSDANDDPSGEETESEAKRAAILDGLTKADFHAKPFPAIDALVAFVATDTQPAPAVQEQLDARGNSRWYPTEGGHLVKMPYQGDPVPMEHFRVEPGGWDHEHCDRCGGRVVVGERIWVTSNADFAVLCGNCYEAIL